jgi:Fe-S cluster biogenesis protein NfuA/nitrite reductase/ring-hydroxylating ferredoxin subunit
MNAHAQPATNKDLSFETLTQDIERFEAVIGSWDESQRSVARVYRSTADALHKEALRKLIAEVKAAPGALDALRRAAADPLVYGVLRYHGLIQASQQERIELALRSVRPMLAAHGGDVEFVSFVPPGTVEVRFLGNCDGCSASALTFVGGVKRAIEEHCPEITQVRQVKGIAGLAGKASFTSPFVDTGTWSFALNLDAIPDEGIACVNVEGQAFIFGRKAGSVSCFRDACAHLGLAISAGTIMDGRITCPHHGFQYDLMTGECVTASEVQLQNVPVRLIGERVEIRLGN